MNNSIKEAVKKSGKKVKDVFFNKRVNSNPVPNVANDGKTHINVSYLGKTPLGRNLGNANNTFTIPELGEFKSIRNFRAFITAEQPLDSYRFADRATAEETIRRSKFRGSNKDFVKLMKDAYRSLFKTNPRLKNQLVNSTLPFDCYYLRWTADNLPKIPVRPADSKWLVQVLEELRTELQNNVEPTDRPDYTEIIKRIADMMEEAVVVEEESVPDTDEVLFTTTVYVDGDELVMTTTPNESNDVSVSDEITESDAVECNVKPQEEIVADEAAGDVLGEDETRTAQ